MRTEDVGHGFFTDVLCDLERRERVFREIEESVEVVTDRVLVLRREIAFGSQLLEKLSLDETPARFARYPQLEMFGSELGVVANCRVGDFEGSIAGPKAYLDPCFPKSSPRTGLPFRTA